MWGPCWELLIFYKVLYLNTSALCYEFMMWNWVTCLLFHEKSKCLYIYFWCKTLDLIVSGNNWFESVYIYSIGVKFSSHRKSCFTFCREPWSFIALCWLAASSSAVKRCMLGKNWTPADLDPEWFRWRPEWWKHGSRKRAQPLLDNASAVYVFNPNVYNYWYCHYIHAAIDLILLHYCLNE